MNTDNHKIDFGTVAKSVEHETGAVAPRASVTVTVPVKVPACENTFETLWVVPGMAPDHEKEYGVAPPEGTAEKVTVVPGVFTLEETMQ